MTNEQQKPDFSNVSKQSVKSSATAIYRFVNIEGEPSLLVKPASEINDGYMNAVLKKGRRMLRTLRRGKMSTATLRENREQDYALFPRYIIEDWPTPPVDVSGQKVPFSKENCEAFLRALPIEEFNDLRDFCGDLENFREDEDDLDAEGTEELLGN